MVDKNKKNQILTPTSLIFKIYTDRENYLALREIKKRENLLFNRKIVIPNMYGI